LRKGFHNARLIDDQLVDVNLLGPSESRVHECLGDYIATLLANEEEKGESVVRPWQRVVMLQDELGKSFTVSGLRAEDVGVQRGKDAVTGIGGSQKHRIEGTIGGRTDDIEGQWRGGRAVGCIASQVMRIRV
jgi:hypothetical protein